MVSKEVENEQAFMQDLTHDGVIALVQMGLVCLLKVCLTLTSNKLVGPTESCCLPAVTTTEWSLSNGRRNFDCPVLDVQAFLALFLYNHYGRKRYHENEGMKMGRRFLVYAS